MKTLMKTLLLGGLLLSSCSSSPVEFDYVHLENNKTGFVTSEGDTAIAIGLKKGSSLKERIDSYLFSLDNTYWTKLMNDMVKLSNDPSYSFDNGFENTDISNGVFRVGMECAYEPFNWTQNDDKNDAYPISNLANKYANGYDVQIALGVANALHMKLEIYQYEWDALLPAVQASSIDGIVAGMSPTEERMLEIDFSSIYYQSNLVVITRKGNAILSCNSLKEIDKEGVKIAAQPGTFHLDALKNQTEHLTVIDNLNDFVAMRVALEAGSIDGYIAEEPTAMALVY